MVKTIISNKPMREITGLAMNTSAGFDLDTRFPTDTKTFWLKSSWTLRSHEV